MMRFGAGEVDFHPKGQRAEGTLKQRLQRRKVAVEKQISPLRCASVEMTMP
jgi:hypothetical protein